MPKDKKGNPQPQSGAGKEEKKQFRLLPEERNKKEKGQDRWSLAPLLHWSADRAAPPSKDASDMDESGYDGE